MFIRFFVFKILEVFGMLWVILLFMLMYVIFGKLYFFLGVEMVLCLLSIVFLIRLRFFVFMLGFVFCFIFLCVSVMIFLIFFRFFNF